MYKFIFHVVAIRTRFFFISYFTRSPSNVKVENSVGRLVALSMVSRVENEGECQRFERVQNISIYTVYRYIFE